MNHWEPQHLQFNTGLASIARPVSYVTEEAKLLHIVAISYDVTYLY